MAAVEENDFLSNVAARRRLVSHPMFGSFWINGEPLGKPEVQKIGKSRTTEILQNKIAMPTSRHMTFVIRFIDATSTSSNCGVGGRLPPHQRGRPRTFQAIRPFGFQEHQTLALTSSPGHDQTIHNDLI